MSFYFFSLTCNENAVTKRQDRGAGRTGGGFGFFFFFLLLRGLLVHISKRGTLSLQGVFGGVDGVHSVGVYPILGLSMVSSQFIAILFVVSVCRSIVSGVLHIAMTVHVWSQMLRHSMVL